MRSIFLPILIAALWTALPAKADCSAVPDEVQEYLRGDPSWKLVDTKELTDPDKATWDQLHPGQCPGFAAVDSDGSGKKIYAVALTQHLRIGIVDSAALVWRDGGKLVVRLFVPPAAMSFRNSGSAEVVWRDPPGKYSDATSHRTVDIPHDSIIYGKLGGATRRYYFTTKRIYSIVASN